MTVHFTLTTPIPAPVEVVFDLAVDIDFHVRSMAHARDRAMTGVTTGRIGLDETVTWRAWHLGVPFTMTSRVTELDRPSRFVDEQVRGPFHRFRHEHHVAANDAGTVLTDDVRFDAPLGPVGWLAERVILERYLVDLIRLRNRHLTLEATCLAATATAASHDGTSAPASSEETS